MHTSRDKGNFLEHGILFVSVNVFVDWFCLFVEFVQESCTEIFVFKSR